MVTQLKIDEILEKFVTDFVIIFECYFLEYHDRLVKRIPKKGKTADAIDGAAEMVKGTLEIFEGPIKASAIVIFEVFRMTKGILGNKCNRDDLKKLTIKIKDFNNNPDDLKKILIESGLEIFRSFESQFARITANDNSWETAIEKVAEDAVIRIINYLKKNQEKDFSVKTILEGVLFGKSKRYKSPNSNLPNVRKGHSISVGDFNLTTSNFFKKVGLSNGRDYYQYKSDKSWPLPSSDWSRCGFRLLFEWEDVSSYTKYIKLSEAPPEKYECILTPEVFERVRNDVLRNIKAENEIGRLEEVLRAMKTEASTATDKIMIFIKENGDAVSKISQQYCGMLKRLDKIEETTADTNIIVKGNRDILLDLVEKVDDIHKGMKAVTVDTILFDIMNPSKWFAGRIEELKRLDESLQRPSKEKLVFNQMICVIGLGGIGKSEMIRQYIKDCREKSDYVSSTYSDLIWINAENEASLTNSFLRLAEEELNIQMLNAMGKPKDIKVIMKNVYETLSGRNRCLIILDNAESQNYLRPFLPLQVTNGSFPYFLLTSRDRNWDDRIEVLPLEEMTMADAIEFVENGLGNQNDCEHKHIRILVETLQYFPLAIQQAISYIKVQRDVNDEFTVSDYLKEFNDKTQILLCSEAFKTLFMDNNYSKTTYTTWNMTFEKIDSNKDYGKLASSILNVMAYLSPDDIHREMFFKLSEVGEDEVKEAVRLLVKYSMAKGEQNQRVLKIHRLVQQVTRIRLDIEEKSEHVMVAVKKLLISYFPSDTNSSESYVARKTLLPHLDAFNVRLKECILKRPEDEEKIERTFLIELLRLIANFTFNLGETRRAKQAYEDILVIAKKRNGRDDLVFKAMILVDLCPVLGDLGEYKEMLTAIEEALPILEGYYDGNTQLAEVLEKKAAALTKLGDYVKAEGIYNRVLDIYELSGAALNIAATKVNLSFIYGVKGDAQKQKTLLQEALHFLENNFGSEHILVASAQFQLSGVYGDSGDFDAQIELLEKCLPIFEKFKGEGHDVARTWLLLGAAYGKKGDSGKNREYSEKALSVSKQYYQDEHHIEVARCTMHLANAIGDLGDTEEELRLLTNVLPDYEKFHVGGSWETGQLLLQIALAQDKLGQRDETKEFLQKAISMMENHPRNVREEEDQCYINKLKCYLSSFP